MAKKKPSSSNGRKIINNMGLFWRRDNVLWRGNRKVGKAALCGVRAGAKRSGETNFWNQVGIYALYTSDYRLAYVGQAGIGDKSCIGGRLKQHTRDDLAGRWDLFSWFGLCKVKGNGRLGARFQLAHTTWRGIADILEGMLIEVAEPPMNSQKGRFGPGVHRYVQVPLQNTQDEREKVADKKQEALNKSLVRIQKTLGGIKRRLAKI